MAPSAADSEVAAGYSAQASPDTRSHAAPLSAPEPRLVEVIQSRPKRSGRSPPFPAIVGPAPGGTN